MSKASVVFTVGDFKECVTHRDIGGMLESPGRRVLRAHGESVDGGGDWTGGFLIEMQDDRYAYSEGWCDYTGWG